MGDILGLGVTHYPALTPRTIRPISLPRTLADPGLPERLRVPAGWPAAMRDEWGEDEEAAAAERHRAALVRELRRARDILDEFAPDFVVVWGDDQYENFTEDVMPAFCVLAYERLACHPWRRAGGAPNYWGEPDDMLLQVPGHQAGAKLLTAGLLHAGFDVAYAYRPLHVELGHAFINTVLYLDWDRRGFPYPLVPFAVNCFGRRVIRFRGYMGGLGEAVGEDELDPPSPSPRRCFELGAACARTLAASPWRVALVASSSWSHSFLTPKHYCLYPDLAADRELFAALVAGDYAVWRERTLSQVEDSGQQELLNWFCLVGAMAELGLRTRDAVLIESHVMNSNKVIASFRA